jgi:Uma2 family endonuclease
MKQILDIPRTAMEVFNMLPEGTRCEVIDNTLFMSPSPSTDHQKLLLKIAGKLDTLVESNDSGQILISPCDVYLNNESGVVQPDIIFVSKKNISIISKKGVYGTPDFVIELLSSNRDYDMREKYELYQRNNVPEYIIIDPETKEVFHYILIADEYVAITSANGILNLKVLNIQITF